MDGSKKIMVTSGPYTFQIIDNTLLSRDKTEIYSRNFKIGGTYPDCVNVSVIYENNKPVDACMPNLFSDPECSFSQPLDKGEGTILMIKTLLQYVYTQLPSLTHVKFDDKSSIECATEEDLKKGSRFRKKGTYVKPMPLYYFSILFNGQTWYEKHFNAKQIDDRHQLYRRRIDEFLYLTDFKTNMEFDKFVSLFDKREDEMIELYQYYKNTNTFYKFVRSIPRDERCRLVGPWIEQFMKFILKDVFYNENWIIKLPIEMRGGKKKTRNNKSKKYYCPNGFITNTFRTRNICISLDDI